jgi:hypothetical protein
LFLKLWSAAVSRVFRRKSVVKIVADTEQMKNAAIRVCAKTAFVGDLQQKVG